MDGGGTRLVGYGRDVDYTASALNITNMYKSSLGYMKASSRVQERQVDD